MGGVSILQEQRDLILSTIKTITRGDWKVLVIDEGTKRLIDNAVNEDDILNENIANIERIEEKRDMNPDMDAIYFLSPKPHIVDCLMADFERRRYKKTFLVWSGLLDPQLRRRIDVSRPAQDQLAGFETIALNFFPRESNLITFREPWSFPLLYHPACNNLVQTHMEDMARKITGICVALGEYPKIRYYSDRGDPRIPQHEARVLCLHLATFVQKELDQFAQFNQNYPPLASRPQGILLITDRSLDLMAPLIHEFTYQAMAHDLLHITDAEKVTYNTVVNEGTGAAEQKDMEIGDKDSIWVDNRHRHMKDTIEKLMGDFQRFMDENPHFTNAGTGDANSLNAIKDMLVGLPQFQQNKDAYSLHLTMAQECMNIFQAHKLPEIASVEQSLATGLDEDFRKPRNLADQIVRLLDDESITKHDRLRLIMLYCLYRDGLIKEDIERLLIHAALPAELRDLDGIRNLDLIGARTIKKDVKDSKAPSQPLFPRKTAPTAQDEEYSLSRFEPNLKLVLEELCKGTLSQALFPYTRPPLDNSEEIALQTQGSLRSAKPTWAKNRMSTVESRQRIIVFAAGGATYSEARACYEVSNTRGRDVFLASSHMLTPKQFIEQVGELTVDRRRLKLPMDQPPPTAPAHLFMKNDPPPPRSMLGLAPSAGRPGQPGLSTRGAPSSVSPGAPPPPGKSPRYDRPPPIPPVAGMANMSLSSGGANGSSGNQKLDKNRFEEEKKEKKKRGFFGHKDKS